MPRAGARCRNILRGSGCSKRSRCKAARDAPSEAYSMYAATSAQACQRSRWAFFSRLLGHEDAAGPRDGEPEPLQFVQIDVDADRVAGHVARYHEVPGA